MFGEERNDSLNTFEIIILEYDLEGNLIDKKTFFTAPPTVTKPECTYDDTGCACGGFATSEQGFVLTGYTLKKNPNYVFADKVNVSGLLDFSADTVHF